MTKQEFKAMEVRIGRLDLTALIDWARELRRKADQEERTFLLFLVALDRSEKWREGSSAATFAAFLDRHDIAKPSRYANWRQVVEEVPWDTIETVGVHVVEVLKTPPELRKKAVERMVEQAKVNKVPLSRKTANDLAMRGVDRPTNAERERTRVEELEAQLSAAKCRIRELEHEVKVLREQARVAANPHMRKRTVARGSARV